MRCYSYLRWEKALHLNLNPFLRQARNRYPPQPGAMPRWMAAAQRAMSAWSRPPRGTLMAGLSSSSRNAGRQWCGGPAGLGQLRVSSWRSVRHQLNCKKCASLPGPGIALFLVPGMEAIQHSEMDSERADLSGAQTGCTMQGPPALPCRPDRDSLRAPSCNPASPTPTSKDAFAFTWWSSKIARAPCSIRWDGQRGTASTLNQTNPKP